MTEPLTAARLAEMAERCEKAGDFVFGSAHRDTDDWIPFLCGKNHNEDECDAIVGFVNEARSDLPACLAEIRRLREALEEIASMECSDGNCLWRARPAEGMHTNGGCRCFGERSLRRQHAAVKARAREALGD